MTDAKTLGQALDALLQPEKFRDYGPNGLQVEGDRAVKRLVSGVTASRALIEAAIAANADAILVHHGLFWRGQDGRVTGWMRERLRLLLAHGIHLLPTTCRWMRMPNWATTPSWAVCSASRLRAGLVSKTSALSVRPWSRGQVHKIWPTMWPVFWEGMSLAWAMSAEWFAVLHGARVVLKAILRLRLHRAWTYF